MTTEWALVALVAVSWLVGFVHGYYRCYLRYND